MLVWGVVFASHHFLSCQTQVLPMCFAHCLQNLAMWYPEKSGGLDTSFRWYDKTRDFFKLYARASSLANKAGITSKRLKKFFCALFWYGGR